MTPFHLLAPFTASPGQTDMPMLFPRLLAGALALQAGIASASLDIAGLDANAAPCEDFYAYANRKWMEATEIPRDRTRWGTFDIIDARNEEIMKAALDDALRDRIRRQIREGASPHHVPRVIVQVSDIPRTISGKITELAVRDVIHGRPVKNTDAMANPEALDQYRNIPELSV